MGPRVFDGAQAPQLLRRAPAPKGSRLVLDGASLYRVSRDARTYTFTIRKGFPFSDGQPVTAANFGYAINRAANKDLRSPAFEFIATALGCRRQAYYVFQREPNRVGC